MNIVLGCIADDYTGASDLASMLSMNGLRTVLAIGVPREATALPETDAVVIALKTRSIEPARAVAQSLEAEGWLRTRGVAHVLFKICSTFDSTDRGNIGPVLDALRARAGAGIVLVNPSFPENGRAVFQGHLFVGETLLQESSLKDHPLNPMRDSNLVRVLARQSAHPVALVPLAVVEEGPAAVHAALAHAAADGAGAAIADSVAPRHLDVIAEAALTAAVSVGASGLGSSLARLLAARGARAGAMAPPDATATGTAVILAGSCSAATLRQIEQVRGEIPCLRLDVARLLESDAAVSTARDWALAHIGDGPVLIASSDTPASVRALQRTHGAAGVGHVVEQALASIAEALVAAGVGRLVVAGGETSGAVVDRLGLEAFRIGSSIAPGVPILHTVGRRHAGLALVLKSGNFGGEDFFRQSLRRLGVGPADPVEAGAPPIDPLGG